MCLDGCHFLISEWHDLGPANELVGSIQWVQSRTSMSRNISFLSLSLWDSLSRSIVAQEGLTVLKGRILAIKSILVITILSVFSLCCVPAPLSLSIISRLRSEISLALGAYLDTYPIFCNYCLFLLSFRFLLGYIFDFWAVAPNYSTLRLFLFEKRLLSSSPASRLHSVLIRAKSPPERLARHRISPETWPVYVSVTVSRNIEHLHRRGQCAIGGRDGPVS